MTQTPDVDDMSEAEVDAMIAEGRRWLWSRKMLSDALDKLDVRTMTDEYVRWMTDELNNAYNARRYGPIPDADPMDRVSLVALANRARSDASYKMYEVTLGVLGALNDPYLRFAVAMYLHDGSHADLYMWRERMVRVYDHLVAVSELLDATPPLRLPVGHGDGGVR